MAKVVSSKHRSAGFTLVEVLLVIFLLSLTALIYAAVFPTSQISRTKAVHTSYALSLAQQKLEEIRSAGYANIQVTPSPQVTPVADIPGATQTVTISQFAANVKRISVVITWSGYRKIGGRVELETLVADHG
ncbi:MAG: type II secretion system GspH family protein [Armatimonadetes bacterium]|nr:type II secretion system GspH family protein [Armatimonadota bacterium]